MKGFNANITKSASENSNFRKVLYTAQKSQLVLMNLKPNEEIGEETHDGDQIITIVEGVGNAVLNGETTEIAQGSVVIVPAGEKHNIVNMSSEAPLKLYTIYAGPQHKDGLVHATKEDGEKYDVEFDGVTTE